MIGTRSSLGQARKEPKSAFGTGGLGSLVKKAECQEIRPEEKVSLPNLELEDDEAKCESFCKLILIYGLNHKKFADNLEEKYEILGSYPDIDNEEIKEQNRYIQDLDLICFPELKREIHSFNNKYPHDALCRAQYFHFISTNELAEVTYITTVYFKEILLCE